MARPRLLDWMLAPIRRKAGPTTVVGVPGTAIYGGFVQTKETNSDLVGTQKYLTYSDMIANTAIIATGLR